MFNVDTDGRNKYAEVGLTIDRCLDLARGWDDNIVPCIRMIDDYDITVWDDSTAVIDGWMKCGTKGRWGDLLISKIETDEIVYVQPRTGWAGIALAALARKHHKKLTLFMPSSKEASDHQLVAIECGASPIFKRIAAMPNLNRMAQAYATERGATFIPFGMDHELVVAAGVKSTLKWTERAAELGVTLPDTVVSVVSTGVLTRTLQIAWPEKTFHGIAVARNMHDGECGSASMLSYDRPFSARSRLDPRLVPFDTAETYDMKGYELLVASSKGSRHLSLPEGPVLFWSVAGNVKPEHLTPKDVDSQRDWH